MASSQQDYGTSESQESAHFIDDRTFFPSAVYLLLFLILAATIGEKVLEAPFWSWNGTRLLSSFLLRQGIPLYNAPHHGALLSSIYGPVTALTYLPVTWMPTLNSIVLLGSFLTVMMCFGGAFCMHWIASRGQWRNCLLPFLCTAFMVLYLEPLAYSCIRPHADAPAIFFGMLSIIVLCGGRGFTNTRMLLSAACAILSIWAKITFLGLPIGLCCFLFFTEKPRQLFRYLASLLFAAIVISAVFVFYFGGHNLYFNLLMMPGHQPWHHASKIAELYASFRWLTVLAFPVFWGLATIAAWGVLQRFNWVTALRDSSSKKIWLASLSAGICLLPFSLMGASKQGGDINSFSFCLIFLLLAFTLALQEASSVEFDSTLRHASQSLTAGLLAVAIMFSAPLIALIPSKLKALPQTEQELVFQSIRSNPGHLYFPWFPLAHFMAEGKVYHFGYGIWDHTSSGFAPTDQEFRTYLPADLEGVAYGAYEGMYVNGESIMRYLPEFHCASSRTGLPHFVILVKPTATEECSSPASAPHPGQ